MRAGRVSNASRSSQVSEYEGVGGRWERDLRIGLGRDLHRRILEHGNVR